MLELNFNSLYSNWSVFSEQPHDICYLGYYFCRCYRNIYLIYTRNIYLILVQKSIVNYFARCVINYWVSSRLQIKGQPIYEIIQITWTFFLSFHIFGLLLFSEFLRWSIFIIPYVKSPSLLFSTFFGGEMFSLFIFYSDNCLHLHYFLIFRGGVFS